MAAGSGAVGVFFVLSGFIIRYVTLIKPERLPQYLADRASRLLSVVLPALGFTIVAELISRHYDPLQGAAPAGAYLLRVGATLTFTSEMWFQDLTPFGNGPFWSLSFEAFYYVLYGLSFYLRGWKRISLLFAVALLAGPSILLLAPIWFLGSGLFDVYSRLLPSRQRSLIAVAGLAAAAAVAACIVLSLPHAERAVSKGWALSLNQQFIAWRLWKASTWYYETGIPAGLALLATLLLFDRVKISTKSRGVRFMRYVADGTFPLYLFHFPMLLLIRALIPYNHASKWQLASIFASVIIVCVLLGDICNWLKGKLRRWFLEEVNQSQLASPSSSLSSDPHTLTTK